MKSGLFSKTFVKYLSSYIFAFLIPVLVTFVFIYNYVFNIYKNELLLNEKALNINFRDTMDVQVKQLYNMAEQISIEDEFKHYYNTNGLNKLTSYKKIYGYDFANSLVSNIVYMQNNLDDFITSNGISLKQQNNKYLFNYRDWPLEVMLEDSFKFQYPTWRKFEEIIFYNANIGRYMTFIYPLTSSDKSVKSVLFFHIREDDFEKIVNIKRSDVNRNCLILNKQGNVLYSSLPVIKNIEASLPSITESAVSEVRQIEREETFLSYSHSNFNEFVYVTLLPESTAMAKINNLKKIVFLLFAFLLLIGVVIIYIFMSLNYNPVKSLKSIIEKNFSKMTGGDNEIETAKMAISTLAETSSRMKEKVDSSMKAVRSTMLYELLWGDYKNILEFNQFGKDYGIEIEGRSFYVAVFSVRNDIRSLEKNKYRLVHFIEKSLRDIPNTYGIENLERDSLIFILSLDGMEERDLKQLLVSLRDNINAEFSADIAIGLSRKCGAEDNIYNLYIEAVTAIEHASDMEFKIGKEIVQFGGSSKSVSRGYPINEIEKFRSTLNDFDADSFNAISMFLMNYIEPDGSDDSMAICILYEMLQSITNVLAKGYKKEYSDQNRTYPPLSLPIKSVDIDLLKKTVGMMCSETAEYIKNRDVSDNESQVEKIKQYVEDHFGEYDFSLQLLADKFDMSLSNIGQYFKRNTGITLSEYLSQLKFDEAKRMLRSTNSTLEEIVDKIGYVSVPSFIRKFKSDMKMTPGEYRSLNRPGTGTNG